MTTSRSGSSVAISILDRAEHRPSSSSSVGITTTTTIVAISILDRAEHRRMGVPKNPVARLVSQFPSSIERNIDAQYRRSARQRLGTNESQFPSSIERNIDICTLQQVASSRTRSRNFHPRSSGTSTRQPDQRGEQRQRLVAISILDRAEHRLMKSQRFRVPANKCRTMVASFPA